MPSPTGLPTSTAKGNFQIILLWNLKKKKKKKNEKKKNPRFTRRSVYDTFSVTDMLTE